MKKYSSYKKLKNQLSAPTTNQPKSTKAKDKLVKKQPLCIKINNHQYKGSPFFGNGGLNSPKILPYQQTQKPKIYPSTAKYSAYALNKQKQHLHNISPYGHLIPFRQNEKQERQYLAKEIKKGTNYDNISAKIQSLQGRLDDIKQIYKTSMLSKKNNEEDKQNQSQHKNDRSNSRQDEHKRKDILSMQDTKNCLQNTKNKGHRVSCQQENDRNKSKLKKNKKYCKVNEQRGKNEIKDNERLLTQGEKLGKDTTLVQSHQPKLQQSTSEGNLFSLNRHFQSRPNKYYVSSVVKAFKSWKPTSFDKLCIQHLKQSIEILKLLQRKNINIPAPLAKPQHPSSPKPTLIFDLDETLIHSTDKSPFDLEVNIDLSGGIQANAYINIRPHLASSLRELSQRFELIVFTASHQCYANPIIDRLDPEGLISHRYFRGSCFKTKEGLYVKDLRILERDLSQCLLIDNAASSYCWQLENGVPIVPFYDNKADVELKHLTSYLKEFSGVRDFRAKNAAEMKLNEYWRFDDSHTLISQLYC